MLVIIYRACVIVRWVICHWELRQRIVWSDDVMYSGDRCLWFLTVTCFGTHNIRLHLRRMSVLRWSLIQLLSSPQVLIGRLHYLLFTCCRQWSHVIRDFLWILTASKSTVLRHWNWILRDWTLHQEFTVFNADAGTTTYWVFNWIVRPCNRIVCCWVTHLCSQSIWRCVRHIVYRVLAKRVFLSLVHSSSIFIFLNY